VEYLHGVTCKLGLMNRVMMMVDGTGIAPVATMLSKGSVAAH
jgi:hypothetical protein